MGSLLKDETDHCRISVKEEIPLTGVCFGGIRIFTSEISVPHSPAQVHKDWRQGVRVQPHFPPHPAHQARQPSLPAGTAGPVHTDQFHRDQRRPGGPTARRRGQHGEARPGDAQGEAVRVSVEGGERY